jgi:hypothetical protein
MGVAAQFNQLGGTPMLTDTRAYGFLALISGLGLFLVGLALPGGEGARYTFSILGVVVAMIGALTLVREM